MLRSPFNNYSSSFAETTDSGVFNDFFNRLPGMNVFVKLEGSIVFGFVTYKYYKAI